MQSKLNRLQTRKKAFLNEQSHVSRAKRKARTRTLIQLGGLIKLIGLSDYCGIVEGMDLQLNLEQQDRAAQLLGILVDAYGDLPENPSDTQMELWKNKGIQLMKSHESRKYY